MEREASPFFWCFFVLVQKEKKCFPLVSLLLSLSLTSTFASLFVLLISFDVDKERATEKRKEEERRMKKEKLVTLTASSRKIRKKKER